MSVLTNRTGTKITGQLLTNKRDVPFILGFRYPLEKKFTLTELERLSGLILTTEFMNKSWSILSRT